MFRSSASSGKVLPMLMALSGLIPTDFDQKRKQEFDGISNHEIDTSKPTAVFKPTEGRAYTLSIALPGSIIAKYMVFYLSPLRAANKSFSVLNLPSSRFI